MSSSKFYTGEWKLAIERCANWDAAQVLMNECMRVCEGQSRRNHWRKEGQPCIYPEWVEARLREANTKLEH